jgi:hypothetical protein
MEIFGINPVRPPLWGEQLQTKPTEFSHRKFLTLNHQHRKSKKANETVPLKTE